MKKGGIIPVVSYHNTRHNRRTSAAVGSLSESVSEISIKHFTNSSNMIER